MDSLINLVYDVKSIKKVSSQILENTLPIMKTLTTDDNYIVDMVIEKLEFKANIDKSGILNQLRAISLNLIDDARKILKEIDVFAKSVTTNSGIESKIKECPFLTQVWFGDFYADLESHKAIKQLNNDLIDMLKLSTEDAIIDKCVGNFA